MKKEHKHLNYEDRMVIEMFIREKLSMETIIKHLGVNRTTIYREIKNRRTKTNDSNIECSINNKFPFVCGDCKWKSHCKKAKYIYHSKNAQIHYNTKLSSSRTGIDATEDELDHLDKLLNDRLVYKNQSIYHIVKTENIGFSLSTIYRYIDKGYLKSIDNGHLLRKLTFKPRRKKVKEIQYINDFSVKFGRMYNDYKTYIKNKPDSSVVQMDIVIGKFEDKKAILTLLFTNSNLMLMFLINKYSVENIKKVFDKIKRRIGEQRFKELFEVILTDNGWEFSKLNDIEFSEETGEKLISLFYCNPYSSWEKGKLERNHEFIRYIIPKGISFDNLNQFKVDLIANNINNTIRKSLNDLSPYKVFRSKYGHDICKLLNIKYITPENINLGYKIL